MAKVKITVGEIPLPENRRKGITLKTGVTLTIGDHQVLLDLVDTTRLAYALDKAGCRAVTEHYGELRPVVFECEGESL